MAVRRAKLTQLKGDVKNVVACCDTRFNFDRPCYDCKYYGEGCKQCLKALKNLYGFRGEKRPSDYVAFIDNLYN